MIAIVNLGPHRKADPLGVRTYSLRINENEIVRFKHRRSDGLGACLLAAAKAVEKQKWETENRLLRELSKETK